MKYGIANLSIIPVRLEASDRSEMVTQILFGESFSILEEEENWVKIALTYDGYEGWIDKKMVCPVEKEWYDKLKSEKEPVVSDTFNILHEENQYANMLIVPGSTLPFYNEKTNEIALANKKYHLKEAVNIPNKEDVRKNMIDNALKYFNAPYLWGGRTPYGIDCSGFTQIVYKLCGVKLPRDASQQVEVGDMLTFVEEANPGDLAFFDNEEGLITHVGIIWDSHKIIHSSGKVRIDNIDHQGIFNTDTQRYTHKLRAIKKIVD